MCAIYPRCSGLFPAFFTKVTATLLLFFLSGASALAATFYVAPSGSDGNDGSIDKPFATISRAQKSINAGDTVYFRGGTYHVQPSQISNQDNLYTYVFYLDKSGAQGSPINYFAYPGEKPVFDFSAIKPADHRVTAFFVRGSWLHFKGLEVIGVQVTITGHTQSECFRIVGGSNDIFEQLSMHDGMGIGIYLTQGGHNLFLNCDAYRNWDSVSEGGKGGNTDGFGCHPAAGGVGNVFRGCRSWFNSDDGYDCINAHEAVTFEDCWAFYNGFTPDFVSRGDGNGFKDGGYGANPASRLPPVIPNHTVELCLSVGNKAHGFYSNHHIGANTFLNNTAYRNSVNFDFLCREPDNITDVPGYGQTAKNNLGFDGGAEVRDLGTENNDVNHNSFDLNLKATTADFLSIDESQLTAPRQANGDLPDVTFMHLAPTSQFIGKGVPLKFPYVGSAPDLGAFEYEPPVEVPDAGFEEPLTMNVTSAPTGGAWKFTGDQPAAAGLIANDSSLMQDDAKTSDGKQAVFLKGKATITQTVGGFIPGAEYKITYFAAQRKDPKEKGQTWDLKVGDQVAASYAPPADYTDYLEYSASFTATAASETISFVGTDTNGGGNTVFLDNVRIVQTNNPPTVTKN